MTGPLSLWVGLDPPNARDCHHFGSYRPCPSGKKCRYRHSPTARKNAVACSNWMVFGTCPDGVRCSMIHDHSALVAVRLYMVEEYETPRAPLPVASASRDKDGAHNHPTAAREAGETARALEKSKAGLDGTALVVAWRSASGKVRGPLQELFPTKLCPSMFMPEKRCCVDKQCTLVHADTSVLQEGEFRFDRMDDGTAVEVTGHRMAYATVLGAASVGLYMCKLNGEIMTSSGWMSSALEHHLHMERELVCAKAFAQELHACLLAKKPLSPMQRAFYQLPAEIFTLASSLASSGASAAARVAEDPPTTPPGPPASVARTVETDDDPPHSSATTGVGTSPAASPAVAAAPPELSAAPSDARVSGASTDAARNAEAERELIRHLAESLEGESRAASKAKATRAQKAPRVSHNAFTAPSYSGRKPSAKVMPGFRRSPDPVFVDAIEASDLDSLTLSQRDARDRHDDSDSRGSSDGHSDDSDGSDGSEVETSSEHASSDAAVPLAGSGHRIQFIKARAADAKTLEAARSRAMTDDEMIWVASLTDCALGRDLCSDSACLRRHPEQSLGVCPAWANGLCDRASCLAEHPQLSLKHAIRLLDNVHNGCIAAVHQVHRDDVDTKADAGTDADAETDTAAGDAITTPQPVTAGPGAGTSALAAPTAVATAASGTVTPPASTSASRVTTPAPAVAADSSSARGGSPATGSKAVRMEPSPNASPGPISSRETASPAATNATKASKAWNEAKDASLLKLAARNDGKEPAVVHHVVTATTPFREAVKPLTDCRYYLDYSCRRESCDYRHNNEARRSCTDCPVWMKGECTNIRCPRLHPNRQGKWAFSKRAVEPSTQAAAPAAGKDPADCDQPSELGADDVVIVTPELYDGSRFMAVRALTDCKFYTYNNTCRHNGCLFRHHAVARESRLPCPDWEKNRCYNRNCPRQHKAPTGTWVLFTDENPGPDLASVNPTVPVVRRAPTTEADFPPLAPTKLKAALTKGVATTAKIVTSKTASTKASTSTAPTKTPTAAATPAAESSGTPSTKLAKAKPTSQVPLPARSVSPRPKSRGPSPPASRAAPAATPGAMAPTSASSPVAAPAAPAKFAPASSRPPPSSPAGASKAAPPASEPLNAPTRSAKAALPSGTIKTWLGSSSSSSSSKAASGSTSGPPGLRVKQAQDASGASSSSYKLAPPRAMGLGTGATLAYGRSAPSSASGVREYVPDERHRSAIGGNHAYGKLGHAAGKPLTMHDAQPRRAAPPMSLALPPRSSRNTLEFLGPASTDGLWSERTHDDPQPLSPRSSMPPGLRPRTASLSLPHPHLPPKPRGPLESVPSPDVVPYATSSSTPQRVSPGVSRMQHQEDDIILPLPMPAPIVSAPLPPPTAPFGMMSGSRNLMPSMHNHHGLSPRSGFVSSPSLVRDASSPQHLPSLFGSVADIWGHPSGVMTTTAAATTTTTAAAAAMTATPTSVGVTANNSSLNARPVLSPRTDADQEQAEHGPSHANSIISRVMDLVEPTMGDCGHTSLAAGAMGSGAPDDSSSCSSSSSSPPSPALGHYQPSPAVEAAIVTSMKSPPSATLPAPRTPRLSMSVSRLANGFVPAIPPAIPPPEEDIVSVSYFWNLEALPLTLPNATVDGVVSAVRRLCNPVQTVKGKRRMAPELDFVAFANFARAADFLPGEVEGDAERELEHADVTMIHTPSGAGAPFVAWVARFLQMHPGRHRIVLLTTAFAGESAARVNRWSTQHGQEIVLLCDSGTADESRLRFPLAALVQASAI